MKKLSVLITLALVVAVGFFAILNNIGNHIIYEQTKRGIEEKTVQSLEQYIQENDVNSGDSYELVREDRRGGYGGVC